jgi:hypothetical protein
MVKKIVLGILLVLVVIVGGVAILAAMQPATYQVERTSTMAAPSAVVFAHVNDFRKWDAWSPWAKRDPNAKNSYEGSSEGKGAIFKWSGNSDVGEGQMTILESQPNELIKIKLDFVRPFEDTSIVEFKFKDAGEKTQVKWEMHGEHNFMSKVMCIFASMDSMIGPDFEMGLASMKEVVEAPTKK